MVNVGVLEEQSLCLHTASGVNTNLNASLTPAAECWSDVGEETGAESAGRVAGGEEMALKGFEGGVFGGKVGEVGVVGEEGGGGCAG